MTRPPHVRPRSMGAVYPWDEEPPRRRVPVAVVEILAGIAGGTIVALALIGVLYLVGVFRYPIVP